ncbi:Transposase [Phytophthora megakarya]|uniref:Transposase n=1 Tax=Phytophthora megakarya TaxID=4795 RepID=A0A225VS34_9STRA|nr:Transposase [Phytophthora megakarya]
MDDSTREQVQDIFTQWHGCEHEEATMVELISYLGTQRDESLEPKHIRKKQLSVLHYWDGLAQFPILRDIALTVFSSSCSSAAAERNFSAHARNRLQAASVEKLVFMVFNSKNFDQEDMEFYDMIDDLADVSEEEGDNNEDSD